MSRIHFATHWVILIIASSLPELICSTNSTSPRPALTPLRILDFEVLARFNAYRRQFGAQSLHICPRLRREAQACANLLTRLDLPSTTEDLPGDLSTTCNENLEALQYFGFGEPDRTGPLETMRPILDRWVNEYHQLDGFEYKNETRHFTQIIWRNTTLAGCAVSSGVTRTEGRRIFICFFSPPGNVQYGGSNKPFRDNILQRLSRSLIRPSAAKPFVIQLRDL